MTQLDIPISGANDEAFASFSSTNSVSLRALATYFTSTNLSASLSGTRKVATVVSLHHGQRERTYDLDVDPALEKAGLTLKKGNKYYIIRETIAVTNIICFRSWDNVLSAEATAALETSVTGKVTFGVTNGPWYGLIAKFDRPHRVFYKTDMIERTVGFTKSRLHAVPTTGPIIIRREHTNP